jgi:hypothetical protein
MNPNPPTSRRRARASKSGLPSSVDPKHPGHIAQAHARTTPAKLEHSARVRVSDSERVPCGARRRRDGQPCEALSVPGKRRCKWHGGCSTGPRTPEGKARALANLRTSPRRAGNADIARATPTKGRPWLPGWVCP